MLRFAVAAALLAGATAASAESIEEKAEVCSACHGLERACPKTRPFPIIWGQNAGYLYLQFRDFQKGARKDDRMTPIAQSRRQGGRAGARRIFRRQAVAEHRRACGCKADADVAMTAIKSVVCTSCHLEEFQGDSSVPRLAGQEHDYLLKTMTDFRTRTRANNPGMSDLMNTVTPEQLAAMAAYLAGL